MKEDDHNEHSLNRERESARNSIKKKASTM